MAGDPELTWNLVRDVRQLFDYRFMVNAFQAGTIVALTAAPAGWFMVLRRQTFVGHSLAIVSFPGASGAILLGIGAEYGYFGFAIAAALIFAAVPRSARGGSQESAIVGTVQAFALALGFLFVTLSHRNLSGSQALLFGTFLGVTRTQVEVLLLSGVISLAILGTIARPLFFASLDPDVAAARGVRVKLLGVIFLLLLGLAAAEASQITGSLLVFALLVLPAAAAERLTAKPQLSLALAMLFAVLVTWLGLALSYYNDRPIGFHITALAFGIYALASATQWPALVRSRVRLAA